MSATKAWNECKASFGAEVRKDSLLEHAIKEVNGTLERIQHQTMSEQKSALMRQQTGILFACAKTSLQALLAIGDPQVWFQAEEKKTIKTYLTGVIPAVVFFLILCGTAVWRLLDKDILGFALLAAAFLYSVYEKISGFFRMRRVREKSNQKFKVEQHIDPDRLLSLFDKLMNETDRHIEELAYLESSRTDDDIDSELLELCSSMLEAQTSGDQSIALQALPSIEQYLTHQDIQIVNYSRNNEQYFDVLPAKKGERTITPALLKNGKLLKKGVAAVNGQQV